MFSAQPGAGHPLGFSVQFVDESKQLVIGFVLVSVDDDGIKQVTAALLHLPGFLDDVAQLLGLSTTHTQTLLRETFWRCTHRYLSLAKCKQTV